jgi:hypothetical protein
VLLQNLQQEIEAIDTGYWGQDPIGQAISRAQDLVEALIEMETNRKLDAEDARMRE